MKFSNIFNKYLNRGKDIERLADDIGQFRGLFSYTKYDVRTREIIERSKQINALTNLSKSNIIRLLGTGVSPWISGNINQADFAISKMRFGNNLMLPVSSEDEKKYLYYDITEDMLENCAVTFSMTDADTGIYRIANSEANLEIKEDRPSNPDEVKYTLTYCFSLKDTKKEGHFYGEFKIDFLGENCGKITLPTTQRIDIYIQDSITVTTVV